MPFLNALVTRPEQGWGVYKPLVERLTRHDVADLQVYGSLKWQLCSMDTTVCTISTFAVAVEVTPPQIVKAVRQLKERHGIEIVFKDDEAELFDHSDYVTA